MFNPNKKGLLIKTPTGFKPFIGVQKKFVNTLFTITFSDGTYLKCSGNHALLCDTGFVTANKLRIGQTVTGKEIINITDLMGEFEVFDPVGVEDHASYYSNNVISHNTAFLGSSSTLISATKMAQLFALMEAPVKSSEGLDIFVEPIPGHTYFLSADVAEGQALDYSAFSVVDVTELPYKQVAKYRNNKIEPMIYPSVIYKTAIAYNQAFVLIEINSIGLQVATTIYNDFSYENLLKIQPDAKEGQHMTGGFSGKYNLGLKQSTQTKRIGCANLKTLIENDKLEIVDKHTMSELTTFSAKGKSYEAEAGKNDDLVMTLVNFSWLTAQRIFRENVGNDIRHVLQKELMNIEDQEMMPQIVIDDGKNSNLFVDTEGDVWVEDIKSRYLPDGFDWNQRFL